MCVVDVDVVKAGTMQPVVWGTRAVWALTVISFAGKCFLDNFFRAPPRYHYALLGPHVTVSYFNNCITYTYVDFVLEQCNSNNQPRWIRPTPRLLRKETFVTTRSCALMYFSPSTLYGFASLGSSSRSSLSPHRLVICSFVAYTRSSGEHGRF